LDKDADIKYGLKIKLFVITNLPLAGGLSSGRFLRRTCQLGWFSEKEAHYYALIYEEIKIILLRAEKGTERLFPKV